ncbi:hypothetical protein N0V90_000170 [Kalmusia sp. IMI 367209]|nr:hypothetical protein N0V90_000170 [Kalmusia sp. IMI 367209]
MQFTTLTLQIVIATILSSITQALDTYDYIIVGAGTSGLVLANRLSEDASITVAVIEPGTDQRNNPLVADPTKFGQAFGTDIDWQYRIPAEPGAADRMTYIRGEAASIDAWESLENTNWTWATLLPYYKKSENYTTPTATQLAAGVTYRSECHGFDGHVRVGYTPELRNGSFSSPVLGAWNEIGLPHNPDLNSGVLRGFGMGPQTLDVETMTRWDAARAYYLPIEGRPNVEILRGAVSRIGWSTKRRGGRLLAEGVHFVDDSNTTQTLLARKEIVLSAGTIRTPLILESSGIGNSHVLTSLGIETVVDLPGVGENLIGQPGHQFTYSGTLDPAANAYHSFVDVADIYGNDTHSIEVSTSHQLSTWAQETADASPLGAPNARSITKLLQVQHNLLFEQKAAAAEILTIVLDDILLSQYWILQPFSRGSVHLRSAKAIDEPLINPRFFSVDLDLASAIKTGKLVRRFWNTAPIVGNVGGILAPSLEVLPENATDSQWENYLKATRECTLRFARLGQRN